jgi:F420H(2)-dependent quinone reductase
VTARPADEQERARLWELITSANPAFAEYEGKTARTIPVLILTPRR